MKLILIEEHLYSKIDSSMGKYSYSNYCHISISAYTIEDKVARPLFGLVSELDNLLLEDKVERYPWSGHD